MNKITIQLLFFLVSAFGFSQVLYQPANWPNTSWSITGSYYVSEGLFEGNPIINENFAYDDNQAGANATNNLAAVSPVINLTNAYNAGENLIYLQFSYVYNKQVSDVLAVQYLNADTGTWVNWVVFNADTPGVGINNYCSSTPQNVTLMLDASTFTPTQLAGFKYRFYFNDNATWAKGFCFTNPIIYSDAPPTCPDLSNITVNNIGSFSAQIGWTTGGSENAWEIAVQPTGTGIPTTNGTSVTTNPYIYGGLTPSTNYEVYVRADCGAGDYSNWVGPVTFTTYINTPPPINGVTCSIGTSAYLFSEEFDTPTGWTGNINTNGGSWEIPDGATSTGTGPTNAYSGSNFMNFEASSALTSGRIVSPAIDLYGATGDIELSFYMYAYGAGMGTLDVGVGTSPTGPFTSVLTWTGQYQTSPLQNWLPVGIDISAYANQIIYVQFKQTPTTGSTSYLGDMSIDFMRIQACGIFCSPPSNLNASNITSSTADISWLANNGESNWEYVIQPSGTGAPTGSGIAISSMPYQVSGLSPQTTYELYIRAQCDNGGTSLWTGPYTFTTQVQTDYTVDCATGPTNVTYCYHNNDTTMFHFTGTNNTYPLSLTFNSGTVQNLGDALIIYDSDGITQLYNGYGNSGNLSGLSFLSTGSEIYVAINSNGSISCANGNGTPWDITVRCSTCTTPSVDYTVISDCAVLPQFVVNVEVTNMGNATTLHINDNQGTPTLSVTNSGIYIFGPYANGTDVVFSTTNADDPICTTQSTSMTQEECPPVIDVACSDIEAGENVTLECGNESANLQAYFTFSGTNTNSYQLSSISCDPDLTPGTPTNLYIDDQYSGIIDIGFNFCFFGNTFNQLVIGANGVVSFNTLLANQYCPWGFAASIPSPLLPKNAIFGVYHDINPAACGNISYQTTGTAPNRAFIISYEEVCQYGCTNLNTSSQIVLHEATNAIEINILDKPICYTWNGGLALAGLQNADGTIGYTPPGRNTQVWQAQNEYWRYVPSGPANYTFDWYDGTTSIGNTPSINVSPTQTTTYTAQISYNKCDGSLATFSDDVTVYVDIPVDANEFTLESTPNLSLTQLVNIGDIGNSAFDFSTYTPEPLEPSGSCFTSGINQTQWFSFIAPPSGEVDINSYIPSGFDGVEMAVYERDETVCTLLPTPGTEIACSTNATTINFSGSAALTPGTQYYIQVNKAAAGADTFGIEVVQLGCTQPIYSSAIVNPDCNNNQYYVDVTVTSLGNGTPKITDGTTYWNISGTGVTEVGPFANGSTVALTLTHGIVSVCDVDLGTFSSNCALSCTNVTVNQDSSCGTNPVNFTWNTVTNATGYYITIGNTPGIANILNADIGSNTQYTFEPEADTQYYVKVLPYNANGSASGCTSYSFTTPTTQCYCTSNPSDNNGAGITSVLLAGSNITIPDATYTYVSSVVPQITRGTNSTMYIGFQTGVTYNTNIWIDFNNDFVFENSELVFSGESSSASPTVLNSSFFTSATAPVGQHRMRIGSADTGQIVPNPCYNGSSGVTVDLLVNVITNTCSPATYSTTSIIPDCNNNQFFVNINITSLGSGSPSITDGINSWPVSGTGIHQVGPFTDGSNALLTIEHGTNATCDVAIGSFTYNCPFVCQPATYGSATVAPDCSNGQFYVAIDITSLGNGTPTITNGTNSWPVTSTGTMQVGPFADESNVTLTLAHGTDATCNVALGSFTYNCPFVCQPATYSSAVVNSDCGNNQFFVNVTITSLGNGSPVITDGTTSWPVTSTGTIQVGPFMNESNATLELEHGTDATCNLTLGTFTHSCAFVCESPTYASATVNPDCNNNQFYVAVNITSLGNGTPVITDGTNSWPVTSTGTMQVGPFASASNATLTLAHGTDAICDVPLGTFTYNCPVPCQPATYTSATINPDCNNNQFYVAVNITSLGNGTPVITNGTTSWPVTSIGTMQVGPFANATNVTLTLAHGTDSSCNVAVGTYTYNCPFICQPATFASATISPDCNSSQFYVAVNITSLGNGTPVITNGTNSWPVTSTGTMQVGPFANTSNVTLTLAHGISSACNVALGTFTYTCPTSCLPATYTSATVNPDCTNNQYYVAVNITSLGNGTPAITNGTNSWPVTSTGTMQVGPFANASNVTLTLTHGTNAICDVALGTFTYTCPVACQPATYSTATVNPDCNNNQYYVAVNITSLGNGTPAITNGTNSWPVTAIGTLQVGPFANATNVTLTLTHGTNATCNVALGSFTYNCPVPCQPATYSSATVNPDCNNNQYYVAVNITSLGNGTPAISNGTTSWPVTSIGTLQIGPFANASNITLTLTHGIDSGCNVTIGNFSNYCPPVNDDLCNALSLSVIDPANAGSTSGSAYSNLAASMEANEPQATCSLSTPDDSVWFSFVAPPTGSVLITTDLIGGTLTDTDMAVYSASGLVCTNLTTLNTSIGCSDGGGTSLPQNAVLTLGNSGELIPGETYYVQVYSGNTSASGTFGIEIIELSPTKVDNLERVDFNYYPNPVNHNVLNLSANMPIYSIEIFNMLGQKVMYLTPETDMYTINMQSLAAGNYMIKALVGESWQTIKIIKE